MRKDSREQPYSQWLQKMGETKAPKNKPNWEVNCFYGENVGTLKNN